jgi:hypothetical protein
VASRAIWSVVDVLDNLSTNLAGVVEQRFSCWTKMRQGSVASSICRVCTRIDVNLLLLAYLRCQLDTKGSLSTNNRIFFSFKNCGIHTKGSRRPTPLKTDE